MKVLPERTRTAAAAFTGLTGCALLWAGVGSAEQRIGLTLGALGAAGYLADRLGPVVKACDAIDALVRSACFALFTALALTAVVVLVPGPVDPAWLAVGIAVVITGLAVLARNASGSTWVLCKETRWHVLYLLFLGAPVRLAMLGYSELQGDEARVMNRAAGLFMGQNAAATVHHKGPGELMLATFWGGLVGRAAEADARFPFALAGVLGILALYAVGRSLFNPTAGLVAGALWATNGYGIAFGRVIQYHTLVVLLTTGALLCAAFAIHDPPRARRHASLALLLVASAAVCGFNVPVLAMPTLLLLITLAGARLSHANSRVLLKAALIVLTTIALACGALWITVPAAVRELGTYARDRVGRGQPFNNLDLLTSVTMQYSSLPYLVLILASATAAVCWAVLQGKPRRNLRIAGLIALVTGEAVLVYSHGQPTWLAMLEWVGLLAACAAIPARLGPAWHALTFSVLLPMGGYLFLILRPGMHWYEIFPALTLLVGGLCAQLRAPRWARAWALPAVGTTLALFILAYPAMMFLRGWPQDAPMPLGEIYRPAVGEPRRAGHLGYPRQEGWKAVAALFQDGRLPGPLRTNQWSDVARWYVPEAEWCSRARRYVLAPEASQPGRPPRGFLIWLIQSEGPKRMMVVDRDAPRPALREVNAMDYAPWFDGQRASLSRPLTVEPRECPRMPPSWDPDNATRVRR